MGKIHALQIRGLRNRLAASLLAAGLLGMAAPSRAPSVESMTDVFVAKATIIKGMTGPQAQITYFALPTMSAPAYSGVVSGIGTGTLTDASANWQQNQFNGSNGSFYAHFDVGYMADITQTDAATKTLSYPGTLPAGVAVGSKFKIRKHLTLADVFGANNQAGLLAGSSPAQADNVLLHVPETQRTLCFFYSSVPGYIGWYRDDYSPANNTVIYPEQGLMIRRKITGNVVLYLCGATQNGLIRAPVYNGFNLLGTLKTTTSLQLSQLNLYTGDLNTGLAPASNPADADNVILVNPDSTTTICFYSNYPGYVGWYDSTFQPAATVAVAPGTPFFVQRKASRGLFHWSVPQE
jgi:hypothetical protein